jgi:hypothetical protein
VNSAMMPCPSMKGCNRAADSLLEVVDAVNRSGRRATAQPGSFAQFAAVKDP